MSQFKGISNYDNFEDVAKDIVDNMEQWRVDSQKKTDVAVDKMIANINKKRAEAIKARNSGLSRKSDEQRALGYNLGHGRLTGD